MVDIDGVAVVGSDVVVVERSVVRFIDEALLGLEDVVEM